jgi:hypothetical protein
MIDTRLWGSVCRRLQCQIADRSLRDHRFGCNHFGYNGKNPFDGILADMRKKCEGNVHDKGAVVISASSDTTSNSKYLADRDWNGSWRSANSAGSWIRFDFKRRTISVEHYTLKSGDNYYPIAWEVEGSDDGSNWLSLDTKNVNDLVGSGVIRTYASSNLTNRKNYFRFIQIRQTGANGSGDNLFALSGVEFFGSFIDPKP